MAFSTLTLSSPPEHPLRPLVAGILTGGGITNILTFNDNGAVTHSDDFGPYTVNADCTGKIFIIGARDHRDRGRGRG